MDIFNDNPKFDFPEEQFPVEPPEDSIIPIIEDVLLGPYLLVALIVPQDGDDNGDSLGLEVGYFTSNYESDPLGQLEDLRVAEVELRVAEIE